MRRRSYSIEPAHCPLEVELCGQSTGCSRLGVSFFGLLPLTGPPLLLLLLLPLPHTFPSVCLAQRRPEIGGSPCDLCGFVLTKRDGGEKRSYLKRIVGALGHPVCLGFPFSLHYVFLLVLRCNQKKNRLRKEGASSR